MLKQIWKNEKVWSFVGYLTLGLCVFGQITIGKFYLLAQCGYMVANVLGVIRDFALGLPNANKVRDIAFSCITLALIVIKIFG